MAKRNADQVESAPKLFVGNLDASVESQHLLAHFAAFGEVAHVQLVKKGPAKGRSKYAFITFKEGCAADKALQEHHHSINGKKAHVQRSVAQTAPAHKRRKESEGVPDHGKVVAFAGPRLVELHHVQWDAEWLMGFGHDIVDLHEDGSPTPADDRAFADLLDRVRRVVWKIFKLTEADKKFVKTGGSPRSGVDVQAFGSRCTGLYTRNCDADMTVCGGFFSKPGFDYQQWVGQHGALKANKLCMHLGSDGGMTDVQSLSKASVPIIKFVDPKSSIRCDLVFNNKHGLMNSYILRRLMAVDVRIPIVVTFIKHFAKRRRIHGSAKAFLSSYALTIMVIHLMQRLDPPLLPLFTVDPPHASLLESNVTARLAEFKAVPVDLVQSTPPTVAPGTNPNFEFGAHSDNGLARGVNISSSPDCDGKTALEAGPAVDGSDAHAPMHSARSLHRSKGLCRSVAQIVVHFFHYYGYHVDYARQCVSIRRPLFPVDTLLIDQELRRQAQGQMLKDGGGSVGGSEDAHAQISQPEGSPVHNPESQVAQDLRCDRSSNPNLTSNPLQSPDPDTNLRSLLDHAAHTAGPTAPCDRSDTCSVASSSPSCAAAGPLGLDADDPLAMVAPVRREYVHMVVEDPVDLSNVCRTITPTNLGRIKAEFARAYNALALGRAGAQYDGGTSGHPQGASGECMGHGGRDGANGDSCGPGSRAGDGGHGSTADSGSSVPPHAASPASDRSVSALPDAAVHAARGSSAASPEGSRAIGGLADGFCVLDYVCQPPDQ